MLLGAVFVAGLCVKYFMHVIFCKAPLVISSLPTSEKLHSVCWWHSRKVLEYNNVWMSDADGYFYFIIWSTIHPWHYGTRSAGTTAQTIGASFVSQRDGVVSIMPTSETWLAPRTNYSYCVYLGLWRGGGRWLDVLGGSAQWVVSSPSTCHWPLKPISSSEIGSQNERHRWIIHR